MTPSKLTIKKTNKDALAIFIKAPKLGKVKTRIANSVGDVQALEIYKKLLTHTRLVVEDISIDRHLFYAYQIEQQDEWPEHLFQKHLQAEGNIGDRMSDAFRQLLLSYKNVVLIGSDCGELDTQIIHQAFEALAISDVVIGPALDGGYYLIGMNHLHSELFTNIDWSTEKVLKQTLLKASKKGLEVSLLPPKSDVDYIEDWELIKDQLRS